MYVYFCFCPRLSFSSSDLIVAGQQGRYKTQRCKQKRIFAAMDFKVLEKPLMKTPDQKWLKIPHVTHPEPGCLWKSCPSLLWPTLLRLPYKNNQLMPIDGLQLRTVRDQRGVLGQWTSWSHKVWPSSWVLWSILQAHPWGSALRRTGSMFSPFLILTRWRKLNAVKRLLKSFNAWD